MCQIRDIIIDAAGFQKDTTGCVLNLAIRAHLSGPGIFGWVSDHCHPRMQQLNPTSMWQLSQRGNQKQVFVRMEKLL